MTLEEKVGQMCQLDGRDNAEYWINDHHVGSFLHVLGAINNELQAKAAQTRLGIPLIFGIDAIHGHAFWPTATIFPTQLALACSWNPDLLVEVGRVTAKEVAVTGAHWTFSPVLGTMRDLRWGRVDETFGEDPYLIGLLGAALVRGYQGDDLSDPHTILACAKHYAGYSETRGGRDSAEADHSQRRMRSLFLKPFHDVAKAGCTTFMAGYHAIDGVPCSANEWLLRDILKDEWGFDGFVVSDWDNIGHMVKDQWVCATLEEAVQRAVAAGNDMAMTTPDFCELAVKLVQDGKLDEALIDDSCRRILRLKFVLGLFDANRYTKLDSAETIIGCADHRAVALEAAYQSIVLLKNDGGVLPLRADTKRIAVIGPNADDMVAQLGDWVSWENRGSADGSKRPRAIISTVLDGIRARAPEGCRVDTLRGCDIADPGQEEIAEAVALAQQADIAILVIGDDTTMNGEFRDRANLDLSGAQQRLVEAVYATGTPTVVVLINGKPLTIPWIAEHVPAIVEAWNPGMEGGNALAGLLFGDRAPEGKLTVSFPYHISQQPVYYNQIPGWHGGKYVDMPPGPLFAFGHGLSYTTFAYRDLAVLTPSLADGDNLRVQVTVSNTGSRTGTEIVQLYVNDRYSSVTTPNKELKAFARVELAPGEAKTVTLEVPYDALALVNQRLETVVEPGDFDVMVGSSSRDVDLLKSQFIVE
ncbi:MAG: glycoside hydrolase family 3 C-terminal domain-containing protein [Anaerolineae bacterium]|nr:glycoside hydrolase family 3 C-terminal domain-containing protein [Anaerolineae bacterium]